MLSAREYFAAAALPALIAAGDDDPTWRAVQLADQLLRDLEGESSTETTAAVTPLKPGDITDVLYAPPAGAGESSSASETKTADSRTGTRPWGPRDVDQLVSDVPGLMPPNLFTAEEMETACALARRCRTREAAQNLVEKIVERRREREEKNVKPPRQPRASA